MLLFVHKNKNHQETRFLQITSAKEFWHHFQDLIPYPHQTF